MFCNWSHTADRMFWLQADEPAERLVPTRRIIERKASIIKSAAPEPTVDSNDKSNVLKPYEAQKTSKPFDYPGTSVS